jgi:creatinine amidohydrolase
MVLARATWQDVRDLSRDAVAVVPTGSLEQHGAHLPLFTDTLLASAVAEEAERRLGDRVLLAPALWMGASGHHMAFPGTVDAGFEAYLAALGAAMGSLARHGFARIFVLNGHGGNTEPNGIACRAHKARHPESVVGHAGYFHWIPTAVLENVLEGPAKTIRHACEAETSLMLHLHPGLVRMDKARDDGLVCEPPVPGLVWRFDECTEEGSFGYATLASAEKGARLFEAAVEGFCASLVALNEGVVLAPEHPGGLR